MNPFYSNLFILLIVGGCLAPAGVADSRFPATLDQCVAIGGFVSSVSYLSIADPADVSGLPSDWSHRGDGAVFAETGYLRRVTAEAVLDLVGGPNLCGSGGTVLERDCQRTAETFSRVF